MYDKICTKANADEGAAIREKLTLTLDNDAAVQSQAGPLLLHLAGCVEICPYDDLYSEHMQTVDKCMYT